MEKPVQPVQQEQQEKPVQPVQQEQPEQLSFVIYLLAIC
jgi:hypothetical protein